MHNRPAVFGEHLNSIIFLSASEPTAQKPFYYRSQSNLIKGIKDLSTEMKWTLKRLDSNWQNRAEVSFVGETDIEACSPRARSLQAIIRSPLFNFPRIALNAP